MLNHHLSLIATGCTILGIALVTLVQLPLLLAIGGTLLGLVLSALMRKRPLISGLFLCLALGLAGIAYATTWRIMHTITFPNSPTLFQAVVVSKPTLQSRGVRFTVKTISEPGKNWLRKAANGLIQVSSDSFPTPILGDVVMLSGTLSPPPTVATFNYPLVLERSGIFAVLNQPHIQIIGHSSGFFFAIQDWVGRKEKVISNSLPEPESSFLSTVLFGDSTQLSTSFKETVRTAGVSHLLTISGTVIILFFTAFEAVIIIPSPLFRLFLLVLAICLLYCITNASEGVLRGGLFVLSRALLRFSGRKIWPLPFLLLLSLLILLINPLESTNAGFYLSISAYTGILCVAPFLEKLFKKRLRLPQTISSTFAASTAVTATTLPVSIWAFGQASFLSVFTSPLSYVVLPLIFCLGYGYILLSNIPFASAIILFPLWLLLHTLLKGIAFLSSAPVLHV